MPGMYVVTSALFVSRARATFRSAEFGFFGVWVYTRTHTPRFSGHPSSAGDFVFARICSRPRRTNCENVGTLTSRFSDCYLLRDTSPHLSRRLFFRAAQTNPRRVMRVHEQK